MTICEQSFAGTPRHRTDRHRRPARDHSLICGATPRATNIATMRRRPVTRSEVRFDGKQITTLPADAVTEDSLGWLVPIEKLFAPLLRSLDRSVRYQYARAVQSRKEFSSLAAVGMKPPEPIQCPWPYDRHGGPHTCRRCGLCFYRSIAGRYRMTYFTLTHAPRRPGKRSVRSTTRRQRRPIQKRRRPPVPVGAAPIETSHSRRNIAMLVAAFARSRRVDDNARDLSRRGAPPRPINARATQRSAVDPRPPPGFACEGHCRTASCGECR